MDIEKELEKIGLNGTEIRVYLFLLEQGVATPSEVARGTGIARTNTYHVFQGLEESGLIEKRKYGKRYKYVAKSPDATLGVLDRKREAMEQVLPDLRALHKKKKNKPVIHFYDGWSEVKDIYTKSLKAEEVYWIGSTESLANQDKKFFSQYQREVKRRGIIGHDILPEAARGKTGDEIRKILGALYEQRFVPEEYGDIETDMIIWDDNIGLISFDKPVFGTLITNKKLADTFRILFKLSWESAEE